MGGVNERPWETNDPVFKVDHESEFDFQFKSHLDEDIVRISYRIVLLNVKSHGEGKRRWRKKFAKMGRAEKKMRK